MSEDALAGMDLTTWFPTYGLLTAQRILERFNIQLTNDELIAAVKNPLSVYYQLLRVPLKNVFNGIVLQQAQDYQVYAQKLFVDYLLSGEGSKDVELPGANTREDLELARTKLMAVGEEFNHQELAQQELIAASQAMLIQLTAGLQNSLQQAATKMNQTLRDQKIIKEDAVVLQAIRAAMVCYDKADNTSPAFWDKMSAVLEADLKKELRLQLAEAFSDFGDPRYDIEQGLSTYLEQAGDLAIAFRSYRSQFLDLILSVTGYIKFLPDYHVDKEKDEENRSSLYFDAHIGG